VKVQNVFTKHPLPTAAERRSLFELAKDFLENEGYHYLGLDHFVLPTDSLYKAQNLGTLKRNFMGYTVQSGQGVLGIGLSSISDITEVLFQNASNIAEYKSALEKNILPITKSLTRNTDDMIRAEIIQKLMCAGTVTITMLLEQFKDLALVQNIFSSGCKKLLPMVEDQLVIVCTCGSKS
jgi:oxygen-independent coproporphyrinogen-3 oxidase